MFVRFRPSSRTTDAPHAGADQDSYVDIPNVARPAYRTPAAVEKSKAEVANLLALGALLAFGVALLAAWSVLGESAYAVKFENSEVPPGTDITTAQTAAWITIGALLFGVASIITAAAVRATRVVKAVSYWPSSRHRFTFRSPYSCTASRSESYLMPSELQSPKLAAPAAAPA